MALRTWGRVLVTALGVAAVAGAGQLGVAYGLGILRLARPFVDGAERLWPGQLAWVAFIAIVSAVAGGLAGDRAASSPGAPRTAGGRAAIAVAAWLGAALVAPLCMHPARAAEFATAADPVLTVGLTAGLGALAGALAGALVPGHRAVLASMAAVVGGAWAVALVSIAPSLGPRDAPRTVRLAVLDLPALSPGTSGTLALIGIPALALLAGAAVAAWGRAGGTRQPPTVAAAGAA
ncbi:MAG TPA: hypothetical protein VES42_21015, partial [Pilimelia sp.]|nr:hypothetical protein [Pilimelia sp.]